MMKSKLLCLLCLLGFVGCASPGPSVRLTLSDGKKVVVSMKDGRIAGEDVSQVRVELARYVYNLEKKQGGHNFGLVFFDGSVPARIKVEDVSDTKTELVVEVANPVLRERAWRHACAPLSLNEPSMAWMHHIDDSFRVYRFEIVLQDGRKLMLHQTAIYPGYVKAGLVSAIEVEAKKPETGK